MAVTRRHYRCRKCQKRQVRHSLTPASLCCNGCGTLDSLRLDSWANKRGWRKWTCYRDCQYGFPHHRGSEKCDYNRDGSLKGGEPPPLDHDYGKHESDEYF